MSKSLFCGCDLSRDSNTVCLMLADGREPIKRFTVDNNQSGAECLVRRISDLARQWQVSDIFVGTEATSIYDWHLLEHLADTCLAKERRLRLYRFNARRIKSFKKSIADKGKTDHFDSFVIAERLRMGRLPKEYIADSKYQPLRKLTRFRFRLMQQIAREKSFFLNNLFLKASAYTQVSPFGSTFSATSLAVINDFFSIDELAAMPLEELTEFILNKSKSHFAHPDRVVNDIKRVARQSYRLRPEMAPSVNLVLASTLNNIRCYKEQVKIVDKAIAENLKAFRHTLDSIPGIALVYSAGILAEIGEVGRFANDGALAQFAGITWPKYQSGSFQAEETTLSHRGNRYLRYYLIEAANSVKRYDATYKKFYEKKYAEANKHRHKRALVLTARKLVRLVWTLLTKQTLYQPGYCSF